MGFLPTGNHLQVIFYTMVYFIRMFLLSSIDEIVEILSTNMDQLSHTMITYLKISHLE